MKRVLVLLIVLWWPVQAATADDSIAKVDPAVRIALAQATDTTTLRVIVSTGTANVTALRNRIVNGGNNVVSEHRFIGALTAQMKKTAVQDLETDPTVAHISLDHVVRSTAGDPPANTGGQGSQTTTQGGQGSGGSGGSTTPGATPGAPGKPAAVDEPMLSTLGLLNSTITGKGVGIAVLDSGLQPSTELAPSAFWNFVTTTGGAAYDDYGHGTHIAGIIDSHANPKGGGMAGVASGARLLSMKVLDGNGQGYTSTVLTALESVINNRGSYGIDVVNLSLGHPITEPAATDPLVVAVETLSRQGLIVVVAAGNWGRNPSTGAPAYAGVTSPGNALSALTVGAIDTNQTVTRNDDQVPAYSSRGPTWYDGRVKPDFVAPGQSLVSIASIGSSLYTRFPDQRVADATGTARYMKLSGTSMATAVTSGVVALMIERHRQVSSVPLTPNDVKAVLQFTAIHVNGSDVLTQGAGALNPLGALAVVGVLSGSALTDLRSSTILQPTTTIGTQAYTWDQAIIWGHTEIDGNTIYYNEPAWGSQTTWGSAIIWGHGTSSGGDMTWDQAATWSVNTIWDPIVGPSSAELSWPELGGQAIIWGHGGPY